ncbi:hypothetical protein P9578_28645 [Brevibacillus choshinensis]|uniref:hypothetical protein n=1 Tax=Brevibacillus choshinensis TaxID=54911 RepID=UPI002E1BA709|nr:hypothetical protein [Brevibacillus choshinensis]MED4784764.1 hypothetical protein [Brevibacillus choshinensis]
MKRRYRSDRRRNRDDLLLNEIVDRPLVENEQLHAFYCNGKYLSKQNDRSTCPTCGYQQFAPELFYYITDNDLTEMIQHPYAALFREGASMNGDVESRE